MVEPVIVPRAEHTISRREIDPDALKVLYRLAQGQHTAYLVGGGVRDLLLGRRPKDFDIATNAHPYEIKKLFRNCWIIGRRFRLAHVKFGQKTIEVATFRKNVPSQPPDSASDAPPDTTTDEATKHDGIIRRDNTFGTPEEDAFRRDFTVNAMFYDIATYSIIDFVGGLGDLERRLIRSIGDPMVRFVEDPVRMLRAAVLSARLGFDIDALVLDAIATLRPLIAEASGARLLEEYYKILRSGYAEASFRALDRLGLLGLMTPELEGPSDAVWDSLARLDAYRRRFKEPPDTLTNAILIGALLVPSELIVRRTPGNPSDTRVSFGILPIARRDLDRLSQVVTVLPRMLEPDPPVRFTRSLPQRPAFRDALLWLEVFTDAPDELARWTALKAAAPTPPSAEGDPSGHPKRRRRRGRRRGGRGKTSEPSAE
ncbi:MAG: polynucleotide adenylyltransferase PcnB [Acidobacteria bacterium]|nr:polynucleotide adenylyltransferase PcnB [Acidobacteriota bacterium]